METGLRRRSIFFFSREGRRAPALGKGQGDEEPTETPHEPRKSEAETTRKSGLFYRDIFTVVELTGQ